MTTNEGPRRDRSQAVREAIKAVAIPMFEERGFEATGIRDIALEAGVNPAIVIRHFGSKEKLFVESVEYRAEWVARFDGPVEELGYRLVRSVVESRDGEGLRVFATSIHTSGRTEIRTHLRESFAHRFTERVIEHLADTGIDDVEIRAHLFSAQLVGLLTSLAGIEDPVLIAMPAEELIARYGALMQMTLTGRAWSLAGKSLAGKSSAGKSSAGRSSERKKSPESTRAPDGKKAARPNRST